MPTIARLLFSIVFCFASFAYAQPDSSAVIAQAGSEKKARLSLPMENSGFEAGMSNGKLPGWRISQHVGSKAYSMTIDTGNAVEGRQSFRMERTSEQIYGLIEQLVAIPAGLDGKQMTYSAMLRTDGVGDDGWCLVVTFHGGVGEIIDQKRSSTMTGTHDWSPVTVAAALPEGTRTVAVGVVLLDKGIGWIDANQLSVETSALSNDDAIVVEYYHAGLDHYFMTASPEEIKALDSGKLFGWARTGESFLAGVARGAGLAEVCRFFGNSFGPKSAHFYTADAAECAAIKNNPMWKFEAVAFHVQLPSADGGCASNRNKLYRLYNQNMSGAPNHRYTTNRAIRTQMISRGWLSEGHGDEGVIACTP